jgi:preprotein translocase subunit SecF
MKSLFNLNIRTLRYGSNALSFVLLLVSLLAISLNGLNWGQDFTGGVVSELKLPAETTQEDLRYSLNELLGDGVSITQAGEQGRWIVRYAVGELSNAGDIDLQRALLSDYPHATVISTSIVGAQVGQDLYEQGGLALLVSLLSILAYLSFRFEWRLATGALVALLHDVVLVIGFFAITGLDFDLTVFAAVLAILGYSLNDSIIIADRIRDILKTNPNALLPVVADNAVIATFARTMVTSGTTLITVFALWMLGGDALQGFAIAMFIGILSGTWSSISMGTVLPEWLKLEAKHYQPEEVDTAP